MKKLSQIEINMAAEDIRAFAIQQTLAGLKAMPHMLPKVEEMAKTDEVMREVLKAYKKGPIPEK